jgi:4-hydroxy-2-oxoglutarate aldolase
VTRALGGVIAPVVTTFDAASGEAAPIPFRANIRAHMSAGLSGIVVAGSTGEAPLLEEEERGLLVEWARPLVPDDRWLLAGAGAESTRRTIARTRQAAERGADAALVVSPHYFGAAMTPEALATHFRRVADESPLPIILYNIPKYTHFALDPGLVAELARHGNIAGIKDSAGELKVLGGYLESQSERFTVLTGHGGSFYPALEMGARGGILAVALFAGNVAQELFTSFLAGDKARAGRAQGRLTPLAREIVAALGVAGVKAAMDLVGLAGGGVRPPLLPLRAAALDKVKELVRDARLPRAA